MIDLMGIINLIFIIFFLKWYTISKKMVATTKMHLHDEPVCV